MDKYFRNIKLMSSDEDNIITTTTSDTFPLLEGSTGEYASAIGITLNVDVDTPSAVTFDSGESEVTTLTFPTKAATTAGDYVVIYDTAGLGWAVAVDKAGGDPAPTGAIWASIPAARKAQANISADTTAAEVAARFELAFDALTSVPFATDDTAANGTMIITVTARGDTTDAVVKNADDSGAGSISEAQTNQGVSSEVDITDNELTIPSHGLTTGLKGQLTTTGTLPAGLSLATDYFVISVDSDTIKLATSLVNAQAGTAIDITNQGADGSVNTFTPTSIAGATYKVQVSTDNLSWVDLAAAASITADTTVLVEKIAPAYDYVRIVYAITAGRMSIEQRVLVKGY